MNAIPNILCIGGHDPTGGAGIQADIETVAALGGRAVTLITALTRQDTHNIVATSSVDATFFTEQAETLLADIRPDAIKIGLIGDASLARVIHALLAEFRGPVVLDPVLAAGGGFDLERGGLVHLMRDELMPLSTLVTPNRSEARRLTGIEDADAAAAALLSAGAGAALVTGADEATADQVVNRLYLLAHPPQTFFWPLLPGVYHGSGCTLASACAVRLALGDDLPSAVETAQRFTWRALAQATCPGTGQALPRRSS